MWYTVKKADLRIFTFMHWFKHTILQFKIIYFCLYRCREYWKYISTTGLILHCLAASLGMTWLEQEAHTCFTCCDHMACKTGQLGLCIDIYQYIYILYLVELSSFLPCLFLQHVSKVEVLSWSHRCRVWARQGGRVGASAPPSRHCWGPRKLHTSQLGPLKCIPCLRLLVVSLKKKFWVDAVPQTDHSSFLGLSGGGQSREVTFCVEIGHLCICLGSGYFVTGATQDLAMPDILVAKNKPEMLVKLYFGLPVPQTQGHCLARPLSTKPIPFPLYSIIVQ